MMGTEMFIWLILDVQEGSKHLDPQGGGGTWPENGNSSLPL